MVEEPLLELTVSKLISFFWLLILSGLASKAMPAGTVGTEVRGIQPASLVSFDYD